MPLLLLLYSKCHCGLDGDILEILGFTIIDKNTVPMLVLPLHDTTPECS